MTPDVARFLLDLLARQTLGAADDDLLRVAEMCARARQQLEQTLTEPSTTNS